jgi:hypothetical protein
MQSRSVYKIPQGKLLKISLEYNEKNKTITTIKIMGDFFAYPEEAIEVLETSLKGMVLERESLRKKIQSLITKHDIVFIGVDADGLTQGILMCVP